MASPITDFFPLVYGPHPEPMCIRCDVVGVRRTGLECSTCVASRTRREREEGLRRAWATVPTSLAWATFGSPQLAAWVPDADAIEAAKAAIGAPLVTLVGDMRAGKTTLAACMLREHVRRGAKATATSADVWHARRARFVRGYDLLRERDNTRLGEDHMPILDVCERASVLVLDELGQGKDPHGVLYALLHDRHARARQTIVTTWMTREQCAERYGGIAGRLFDDGVVIRVRKAASS